MVGSMANNLITDLEALEERLDACTGVDWSDVQDKLRAQFDWEFEGMR